MITDDPDVDFITILPTVDRQRFLVVIMHYNRSTDEYVQTRISQPYAEETASNLAASWSAATHLQVRR